MSPYLSLVLHGSYEEVVGTRAFACGTLALRFHPAGEEHADTFGPRGAHCVNLQLGDGWQERLGELVITRPVIAHGCGNAVLAVAAWTRRAPELLEIEDLTIQLLEACATRQAAERLISTSGTLRRAVDFIEAHFTEPLTLSRIAAVAGVHLTHLARVFRSRLGCTVGEFVRARRVREAQAQLLISPDTSISRIAAATGFADHAHLTRVFAEVVGVPPSEFRRLAGTAPSDSLQPPLGKRRIR